MNFDFHMPVRLITGEGCVRQHPEEFAKLGTHCLIVTSKTAGRLSGALDDVIAALGNIPYTVYDKVEQNPSLLGSQEAGELARECGADFIVGIGGGSPLDAAKAAAVFATNKMDAMDIYKLDWKNPALPMILIGTTAGTGSEIGPFSVLTMPDGHKKSIGADDCLARVAFGDPKYTYSLPLHFTVSTALDALAHALEGYFSTAANAMSDVFALAAMELLCKELTALRNIKTADGITKDRRANLYFASVLAGVTLGRCATCYCHNLGYHLTEEHHFAHGTACAVFLPGFLRRSAELAPDKADRLCRQTGCTIAEICALIEAVNEHEPVKLDAATIRDIAGRGVGTKNFERTLGGFTAEDAVEELQRLFG